MRGVVEPEGRVWVRGRVIPCISHVEQLSLNILSLFRSCNDDALHFGVVLVYVENFEACNI